MDHPLLEFQGELADPVQVFFWRFVNDVLGRPGSLGQHTFAYQSDQIGDIPANVGREKKMAENDLALQASPTKEEENRIQMYTIMALEVHGWGLCVSE